MLRLEVRPEPSAFWRQASPFLALLLTVLIGVAMFVALGKDPVKGLSVFFWEPIKSPYALFLYLPLLFLMIWGGITYRKEVGGYKSFKQAFIAVFIISVIASFMFDTKMKWTFTEKDIRSRSLNTPFVGTERSEERRCGKEC